ncbi:MAG: 1,4-alpha-glucan-branching enzyme, partial [Thermodesulfobacteriota bacterium]
MEEKSLLTGWVESDPFLKPFQTAILLRNKKVIQRRSRLVGSKATLVDFASGHEYFGLHYHGNEWVFREWAPNAEAVYLIGEFNGWQEQKEFALDRIHPDGHWEIRIPSPIMGHQSLYRLRVHWPGGCGDRIPAFARRVLQDSQTL